VSPSDLAFILKQIKIAEKHVADTTPATGACGALRSQLASPLVSFGLRTVDGSCNNLVAGKERSGAADEEFPRLAAPVFKAAESNPPAFGPPAPSSYAQKTGNVFDRTFKAGVRVEQAIINREEMQFLYRDGDDYVFMNNDTYDQMHVAPVALGLAFLWLAPLGSDPALAAPPEDPRVIAVHTASAPRVSTTASTRRPMSAIDSPVRSHRSRPS